jgi:hypothetical protein
MCVCLLGGQVGVNIEPTIKIQTPFMYKLYLVLYKARRK